MTDKKTFAGLKVKIQVIYLVAQAFQPGRGGRDARPANAPSMVRETHPTLLTTYNA